MPNRLFSLAYFSRNAIVGSPTDVQDSIAAILRTARRTNPRYNVTGALLYSDGCFAQVLEGRREDVEHIFESIQCDLRHSDVTIMHLHTVEERSFAAWSMAFAGIDGVSATPTVTGDGMLAADDILSSDAGQNLLAALRSVVHRDELGRVEEQRGAA
ncbi:MAG: BLUF domain-containing protein [Gemmatimonadaceae bacterium]|nr:BLUF domain-containing protein [Gemmatimonadaceae bacterium]